jgi:hypothetical protein
MFGSSSICATGRRTMDKKQRMERARVRTERWAATDPKMRELRERIDYHRARLAAAERDQAERRESS